MSSQHNKLCACAMCEDADVKAQIKRLRGLLDTAQDGLRVASEIQYAQAEELARLRPLAHALTTLREFWATAAKTEAPDG